MLPISFRLLPLGLALAPSLPGQSSAVPPDAPVALEHLIVTAHPYARSQIELTQPTSVLLGRDLALHQASSLGDLMTSQPGISATAFGPGASRPVIRGLGGDRVRVLDNGTGTIDASVISPDHAVTIDPLLIERVETVRGPASLLYGGAAVGGVVNVITHRIHQTQPAAPIEGRAEFRLGSVNDERAGGIVAEGGSGGVAWHVDAFRRRTADIDIPGFAESARLRALEEAEDAEEHDDDHPEEEKALGTLANTAIETTGGAAGFSLIGQRGYVGVAFSGLDSLYGIPAGAHAHEAEGHAEDEEHAEEEEAETVRIDLRQRRLEAEGSWQLDAGVWQALRFKFARADYRHVELEGDELGTTFTNEGHEARIEALHENIGRFTGAIGAQFSYRDFDAIGAEAFVPPSETRQAALFIFEEVDFSPVLWQLGARLETQEVAVGDGSGRARDDDSLSLSTGTVWTLSDSWTLAAALTRTQRAPNAQELFADGPHLGTNAFEIGDPTLGRESSLGLDVTLRRRTGLVTGSVTVFVNDFDRFIYEAPTGAEEDGLPVFQFVQTDAQFSGAELETIWHLHQRDGHTLDLTFGADMVRARDRESGENLPRIPPARLRSALDWSRGPFTAGAEIQWVAAQDRVAANELPTDGYVLASAYLGYRFVVGASTWDIFVRGTNLTDDEARLHTSFLKDVAPLAGRNFSLGVRLGF